MTILFDQGTPVPLRDHLLGHQVDTAFEQGWSNLNNGDLLEAAEQAGYDMLVTTDQSLKYQQNLAKRTIAIVVLRSTSWPLIKQRAADISALVDGVSPGDYLEIVIP